MQQASCSGQGGPARVKITAGTEGDLAAIVGILNNTAASSIARFETRPVSVAERRDWFGQFGATGPYRLVVARRGDQVLGYACSQRYRDLEAFRETVEVSIALDASSRGQGAGTALYRALFDSLAAEPSVHVALAGIALPNDASVALHRRFGFTEVGTFREYAIKNGQYISSVWMQRACHPERSSTASWSPTASPGPSPTAKEGRAGPGLHHREITGHRLAGAGVVGGMRQEEIWDAETAEAYDTLGAGMFAPGVLDPAVDRLAGLAAGGRALEFAIGTGRVAIPLAGRGIPVTGIELSQPMIDRLRAKAGDAAIPVIAGDMTTARAPGQYALVYLVYNAISCLLTQAGQVACLRNAARHLTPEGRLVIELWVPELRRLPPGQQAVAWPSSPGSIIVDTYDVLAQHVVSHHFRFGDSRQARLFRSPHRYIWPAELDLMAQLAGFELESRHADWPGAEFTADSRSHVSVYRIPPEHNDQGQARGGVPGRHWQH